MYIMLINNYVYNIRLCSLKRRKEIRLCIHAKVLFFSIRCQFASVNKINIKTTKICNDDKERGPQNTGEHWEPFWIAEERKVVSVSLY